MSGSAVEWSSSDDDDATGVGGDTGGKRAREEQQATGPSPEHAGPAAAAAAGAGAGAAAKEPEDDAKAAAAAKKRRIERSERIRNALRESIEREETAFLATIEAKRAALPFDGPHPLDFDEHHTTSHMHGPNPDLFTEAPVLAVWRWKRYIRDSMSVSGDLARYREHVKGGNPKASFEWNHVAAEDLAEREFQRLHFGVVSDAEDDTPAETKAAWVWRHVLPPRTLARYRAWKANKEPSKPRFDWHTVSFLDAHTPLVDQYQRFREKGLPSDTEEDPPNPKWIEHNRLGNALGGGGKRANDAVSHSAQVIANAKRDGPILSEVLDDDAEAKYTLTSGELPAEFLKPKQPLPVLKEWAWSRYTRDPGFEKEWSEWVKTNNGDDSKFPFSAFVEDRAVIRQYRQWRAFIGADGSITFDVQQSTGVFKWAYHIPPALLMRYRQYKQQPQPKPRFPWFQLQYGIKFGARIATDYTVAVEQGIPSDTEDFPPTAKQPETQAPRTKPSFVAPHPPPPPRSDKDEKKKPAAAAAAAAAPLQRPKRPPGAAAAADGFVVGPDGRSSIYAEDDNSEEEPDSPTVDPNREDEVEPETFEDYSVLAEYRRKRAAKQSKVIEPIAAAAEAAGENKSSKEVNGFLKAVLEERANLPNDGPNFLDFDQQYVASHPHQVDPTLAQKVPVPRRWMWQRYMHANPEVGLRMLREHKYKKLSKATFTWTRFGITPEVLAQREFQRTTFDVDSDTEFSRVTKDLVWRWSRVLTPEDLYRYRMWKYDPDPEKPRFDWHTVGFLSATHPVLEAYAQAKKQGAESDVEEEPLSSKWVAQQRIANATVRPPPVLPRNAKRDGPLEEHFTQEYAERYGKLPKALRTYVPTEMPRVWFWRRYTSNPKFGTTFLETRRRTLVDLESVMSSFGLSERAILQFDQWKQQRGERISIEAPPHDGAFHWRYWIPPFTLRLYRTWKAMPEPKKPFPWFMLAEELGDDTTHVTKAYAEAVEQGMPSDTEDFEPLPSRTDPSKPAVFDEVVSEGELSDDEDDYGAIYGGEDAGEAKASSASSSSSSPSSSSSEKKDRRSPSATISMPRTIAGAAPAAAGAGAGRPAAPAAAAAIAAREMSPSPQRLPSTERVPAVAAAAAAPPLANAGIHMARVRRRVIPLGEKQLPNGPVVSDFLVGRLPGDHWKPTDPNWRTRALIPPPSIWNWARTTRDTDLIDAYHAYWNDGHTSTDEFPWDTFGVSSADVTVFNKARETYAVEEDAYAPEQRAFRWRDWLSPSQLSLYREWRALPSPKPRFPWFLFPGIGDPKDPARVAYDAAIAAGQVSDAEEEPPAEEKKKNARDVISVSSGSDTESVATVRQASPPSAPSAAIAAAAAEAGEASAASLMMEDDPSGSVGWDDLVGDGGGRKYAAAAAAVVAMQDTEPAAANAKSDDTSDVEPRSVSLSVELWTEDDEKRVLARQRGAAAAAAAAVDDDDVKELSPMTDQNDATEGSDDDDLDNVVYTRADGSVPDGAELQRWESAKALLKAFPVSITGLKRGETVRGIVTATAGATFEYAGNTIAPDESKVAPIREFAALWTKYNERMNAIGHSAISNVYNNTTTDISEAKGEREDEPSGRFDAIQNPTLLKLPSEHLAKYATHGAPLSEVYDDIIMTRQQTISHFFNTSNWSIQTVDPNVAGSGFKGHLITFTGAEAKGTFVNGLPSGASVAIIIAPGVAVSLDTIGAANEYTQQQKERMTEVRRLAKDQILRPKRNGPFPWLNGAGIHMMSRILRTVILARKSGVFDGSPLPPNGDGLPTDLLIYMLVRKMIAHSGVVVDQKRLMTGMELLARTLLNLMLYEVKTSPMQIAFVQGVSAVCAVSSKYCMTNVVVEMLASIAWSLYAQAIGAPTWPGQIEEEPDVAENLRSGKYLQGDELMRLKASVMANFKTEEQVRQMRLLGGVEVPVLLNMAYPTLSHRTFMNFMNNQEWHAAQAIGRIQQLKIRMDLPPRNDPLHLSDAVDNVACPTVIGLILDPNAELASSANPSKNGGVGPFSDSFSVLAAWQAKQNVRRNRPRTETGQVAKLIKDAQRKYFYAVVVEGIRPRLALEEVAQRPSSREVTLTHILTTQELCVAIGVITVTPAELGERKSLLKAPVIAVLDYSSPDVDPNNPKPRFHVIPSAPGSNDQKAPPQQQITKEVVEAVNAVVIRRIALKGVPWSRQFSAPSPTLKAARITLVAGDELKKAAQRLLANGPASAAAAAAAGAGAFEIKANNPLIFAIKFEDKSAPTPWEQARVVRERHPVVTLFTDGFAANPLLPEATSFGVAEQFERNRGDDILAHLTPQQLSRFIEIVSSSGGSDAFRMPRITSSGQAVSDGGLLATRLDMAVFNALLLFTHLAPGIIGKRVTTDGEIEFLIRSPIGMRVIVATARRLLTSGRNTEVQQHLARLNEESRALNIERSLSSLDVVPAAASQGYVIRKLPNLNAPKIGWGTFSKDPRPLFKQQMDALERIAKQHAQGFRVFEVLPPGAGKTVIARDAFIATRNECTRIIYAAPLESMKGSMKEWSDVGFVTKVFTRTGVDTSIRKTFSTVKPSPILKPNEFPPEYTVTFVDHSELASLVPLLSAVLPRSKVVIDEVHRVANGATDRGRAAVQLFLMSQDSIGLTATLPINADPAGMQPFFNAISPFYVGNNGSLTCLIANMRREALVEQAKRPVYEVYMTAQLTPEEEAVYRTRAPEEWGGTNTSVSREDLKVMADVTRGACLRAAVQAAQSRVNNENTSPAVLIATDVETIKYYQKAIGSPAKVQVFANRSYTATDDDAKTARILIMNYKTNAGFSLTRFAEKISLVEPSRSDQIDQLNGRFDRPGQVSPVITHTWIVDAKGFWARVKKLDPFPISKDGMLTELAKVLAAEKRPARRPAAAAAAAAVDVSE
jgi:superfamily II DNA or RNA helicase